MSRAHRQSEDAQGAEHRPALLEGEPDRTVDEEETHRERQKPEGGEVEMEAVGEPGEVFGGGRCAAFETVDEIGRVGQAHGLDRVEGAFGRSRLSRP